MVDPGARAALREFDQAARPVSFPAVARQAQVSRQWLYQQPELRAELERLGLSSAIAPPRRRPRNDRPRRRFASAFRRCWTRTALREELNELRDELALAYGHQRERDSLAGPGAADADRPPG